ncbi:MAG: permease, partial [Myxococcota bacterium]
LGGLVLIAIMAVLVRLTLPRAIFEEARDALREQDARDKRSEDPVCGMEGTDEHALEVDGEVVRFCSEGCLESYQETENSGGGWLDELSSWGGWYKVGNRYRKEWSMIYKDVVAGFVISGFVIVLVPREVWTTLFWQGEGLAVSLENAFMGVAIAVISFVGSIGNVPFAVALWGGGVSFAGVIAFIYSDLITIPVLNVYRKYYGWKVMFYIFAIFFVTMAVSGFLMEELFTLLEIVPELSRGQTASEKTYFQLNYTFYLNLVAIGLSGFLYYAYRRGLSRRGDARDPVCGMRSDGDISVEVDGAQYSFCSKACRRKFEERPAKYLDEIPRKSQTP